VGPLNHFASRTVRVGVEMISDVARATSVGLRGFRERFTEEQLADTGLGITLLEASTLGSQRFFEDLADATRSAQEELVKLREQDDEAFLNDLATRVGERLGKSRGK